MKVDEKSNESVPRVAQRKVLWIDFNDKAIDKLFIKSGNRVTVKFNNISVSYLTGLNLLYSPKTEYDEALEELEDAPKNRYY